MRMRTTLALSASIGVPSAIATCTFLPGVTAPGGSIILAGAVGAALGLIAGALIATAALRPLPVLGALLVLAPVAAGLAAVLGVPALGLLPPLLALASTSMLALRGEVRAAIAPDLLTAAVVIYAVLGTLGTLGALGAAPAVALARWALGIAPIALYFAGMMLAGPPAAARDAGPPADTSAAQRRATARVRAIHWLVAVCGVVALVTAVPALVRSLWVLPLPLHGPLPSPAALAAVSGMGLLLALTWDTERLLCWSVVASHRALLRIAPMLGLLLALLLLATTLALTRSRVALVGLVLGVLWVSLIRRRYGGVLALALVMLPLLALVPRAPAGWLRSPWSALGTALAPRPWDASSPLTQYVAAGQVFGLPALLTLLLVLAIAIARFWRAYRQVRPLRAEAGMLLVASGLVIYVAILGLAAAPLDVAAPAMLFWLALGMANGVAAHVERGTADGLLRGEPLRVAYVVSGVPSGEAHAALLELFQCADRNEHTPLLVTLGEVPLAVLARTLQVSVRVVPPRQPARLPRLTRWTQPRGPKLRRIAVGRATGILARGVGALVARASVAREWAELVRAVLALRPDLIVTLTPEMHLRALLVARITGVPVQWQVRVPASRTLQPALDALVPWTAGVVAPSQAAASTFRVDALRPFMRVVRPGVALPAPAPERVAEVRHQLEVDGAWPVLACIGPVGEGSGHEDVLAAVTVLRGQYPHLRVLCASEVLSEDEPGTRASRLRRAAAMSGLDGMVRFLGTRADVAEIVAASDVAIVPATQAPASRGLLLALALGRPIVATGVEAHVEQLAEAWGFELATPGEPAALVNALHEMLPRLDDYARGARRNPGLVREWYSAAAEAARLQSVYRQVCLPGTGPRLRWPRRQARFPIVWRSALRVPRA